MATVDGATILDTAINGREVIFMDAAGVIHKGSYLFGYMDTGYTEPFVLPTGKSIAYGANIATQILVGGTAELSIIVGATTIYGAIFNVARQTYRRERVWNEFVPDGTAVAGAVVTCVNTSAEIGDIFTIGAVTTWVTAINGYSITFNDAITIALNDRTPIRSIGRKLDISIGATATATRKYIAGDLVTEPVSLATITGVTIA